MTPRKLRKNINKITKQRFSMMPKKVAAGKWGTRPRKNRMVNGKPVAMIDIVDVGSRILQLVMPKSVFESAMKRAGFDRLETKPEAPAAMSQNEIPEAVQELAMPMPVAA